MEGKFELQFEDGEYYLVDGNSNDTIGTTDKVLLKEYDSYMKKLSLKNCQAIENGYDLDELAREACNITDPLRLDSQKYKQDPYFKIGFNKGFQKALEILGDKKFSEKDVISMIEKSRETGLSAEYLILTKQQTEFDVEIEMEKVKDETKIIGSVKGVKGSGHKITTYKSVPKLDANGCLILRRC
jgi:hypothetical protein